MRIVFSVSVTIKLALLGVVAGLVLGFTLAERHTPASGVPLAPVPSPVVPSPVGR